ncbi:MAG: SHOCT domain-containing protein [Candidatus Thermoplasmatota archaeon]|nr:SHOCT domain-containing protein [Candidatus Thermoplasmatota archaeon]MCL5963647.1 SHOCT domain-containing protein [Candidatus Thermoplasmatota archaeon]
MKWMWIGLAIMFIFIGAAVFIEALLYKNIQNVSYGNTSGIVSTIVWAVVALWVITLIFWPGTRHSRHYRWYDRGMDEALAILRKRYASGEITKEQFDRMMQDLKND